MKACVIYEPTTVVIGSSASLILQTGHASASTIRQPVSRQASFFIDYCMSEDTVTERAASFSQRLTPIVIFAVQEIRRSPLQAQNTFALLIAEYRPPVSSFSAID